MQTKGNYHINIHHKNVQKDKTHLSYSSNKRQTASSHSGWTPLFCCNICTGVLQVSGTTFTAYGHIPHHTKTTMQIDSHSWDWPWDKDRSISCLLVMYLVELQNIHKGTMACNLNEGILQAAKHSRSFRWGGSWQISMGWWPVLLHKPQTIFCKGREKDTCKQKFS